MSQRLEIETATMAKLYADQGYWHKAADIYRRLSAKAPDRMDLKAALLDIEKKMVHQMGPSHKELGLLLREWVALEQAYVRRRSDDGKEAS